MREKKIRVNTSRYTTLKHLNMKVNLPEGTGQFDTTTQRMPFSDSMMQGQTSESELLHHSERAKRLEACDIQGYRLLAHLPGCLLVEALVCDGGDRHFCLDLT